MGQLTTEERRRLFLAQQQSAAEILARLRSAPVATQHGAPRRGPRWLPTTAIIATLMGGGWVAYRAVEFHLPKSIVEMLLPRLG